MGRTSFVPVVLATATALLMSVPAKTQQSRPPRPGVDVVGGHEAHAREAIVKFRRPLQPAELGRVGAQTDADVLTAIGRTGARRVRSRTMSAAALVDMLKSLPDVEYAEPNFVVHALAQPNDVSFPSLWGLLNTGQAVNGGLPGTPGADIHVSAAWDVSVGSTANVVGIVDTGIDYTHVDLAPNVWSAPSAFTVTLGGRQITCPAGSHGFNAIALTCDPMDDHDHGTHVSGTIGAVGNNAFGVVGVNWVARLMGLKFIDASGSGTVADAINAIDFAIQAKAAFGGAAGAANVRVLSNSWGGTDFSQALLDEINAANGSDMLFVAAAGNSSFSNDILPEYPASYNAPNVVAVAATTNQDSLAFFSNYGPTTVHLGAPGVDIYSTIIGNDYGYLSGTSMATPHVSGAAALVLSKCALDTAGLKATLVNSVEPVAALKALTISGGRLDVNNAIHSCSEPPGVPAHLTALGGDTQVMLGWDSAAGAISYNVKRSGTPGGPYTLMATGVTAHSYTDTAVVNGTTYYYVVSAVNTLGESGDSNEASATPALPPDLAISSLSTPLNGGAGATIPVSEVTKNQGTGAAGASTTRFYLSTNIFLDANDIALDGEDDVPVLQPGQSRSVSLSLGIPSGVAPGVYAVLAVADADHVLNDSQRANNTAWKSIIIGPNLAISAFTVPTTAAPGTTIVVSETTRNGGGGSAPASTTRFYLSSKATLDSTATPLTPSVAVAALAPGAASSASATLTLPAGLTPATYYVIAKTDADNIVAESSESDNSTARAVQVGGDLIESAFALPPQVGSGATILVTDTTKNQGGASVDASVTRFFVSTKATLDASATQLAGARQVPQLAPGATSSGSTTLTVPSLGPGVYYLIADANGDGSTPEAQTTNNAIARSFVIGPDLAVSSLTSALFAPAGSTVLVGNTVKNQGSDGAGASTVRFYISTSFMLNSRAVPLGSRTVPALAAGGSSSASTSVTIPIDTPPGTYAILAQADADGNVAEGQESNNVAWKSIIVTVAP